MAPGKTTLSELPPTSKTGDNPNICHRNRVVKDGRGNDVTIECGGAIVVDTIVHSDDYQTATVKSHCGGCGEKEEDQFTQPPIKHGGQCMLAQNQGQKPLVFLATVIPEVLWKCAGVITPGHDHDVPCDGLVVIKDGGFPY